MNSLMGRSIVTSDPERSILKSGTPKLTFAVLEQNGEQLGITLLAVAQAGMVEKLSAVRREDELLLIGALRPGQYPDSPLQFLVHRADLLWVGESAQAAHR
jgi:hypothetical protein